MKVGGGICATRVKHGIVPLALPGKGFTIKGLFFRSVADPDPPGSAFIWAQGSGSLRIKSI